jgi:hypothetical protein
MRAEWERAGHALEVVHGQDRAGRAEALSAGEALEVRGGVGERGGGEGGGEGGGGRALCGGGGGGARERGGTGRDKIDVR